VSEAVHSCPMRRQRSTLTTAFGYNVYLAMTRCRLSFIGTGIGYSGTYVKLLWRVSHSIIHRHTSGARAAPEDLFLTTSSYIDIMGHTSQQWLSGTHLFSLFNQRIL